MTAPNDDTKNAPTLTPPEVEAPKEEKKALKSVKDVASEVLSGRWGATFAIAQNKLEEAGYDVDEVWTEFNRRKAAGAPYAF